MVQPRIKTIGMVKEFIKENDRNYSVFQLWQRLPKKMMYQTYKAIVDILIKNNEIIIDENKKISYIDKPEFKIEQIDREMILDNLSFYGYDLISYGDIKKKKIIKIEDLIFEILTKFPEARFIEAIPTLMVFNKINPFELYKKAHEFGLINKIGFLLENAFGIAKKIGKDIFYLKSLLNELKEKKSDKIDYFSSFKDKSFLERTTPSFLKKWNLLGNFSKSDFFKEAYI